MSDPKRAFGQRVRELRKQNAMSQEALGHAACLHRTYIGAVERGERNISLVNIIAIADALSTAPADLLEGIKRELSV